MASSASGTPVKPAATESPGDAFKRGVANLIGLIGDKINLGTRMLPDAVFYSTLFFSLVTMNYTLTVISIFMLVVVGLRGILGMAFKNIAPLLVNTISPECTPGFETSGSGSTSTSTRTTIAGRSSFPSPIIFPAAALAAYNMTAVANVSDSLNNLGPGYAVKPFLSVIFSVVILAVIMGAQIKLSCESFKSAMGSAIIGLLIGFLGFMLANHIFGNEGTNVLGIPLLTSKAAEGNPIYICGPTSGSSSS